MFGSCAWTWAAIGVMMAVLITSSLVGVLAVPIVLRAIVKGIGSVSPFFLKLPVVGGIWSDLILVRFVSHLALSVRSGMPLADSLPAPEAITVSRHVREQIRRMKESLAEGEDMASAVVSVDFFPNRLAWIFTRGRDRGDLAGLLLTFAGECRERVEDTCGRLLRAAPTIGLVFALFISISVLSVAGFSGCFGLLMGLSGQRFDPSEILGPAVTAILLGAVMAALYAVTEWAFRRDGVSVDVTTALGASEELGLPVSGAIGALAHHAPAGPRRELHEALAQLEEKYQHRDAESGARGTLPLLGFLCRIGRLAGKPAQALAFYARRMRTSLRARHSIVAQIHYPFIVAFVLVAMSFNIRVILRHSVPRWGIPPSASFEVWKAILRLSLPVVVCYTVAIAVLGAIVLFAGHLPRLARARMGLATELPARAFARLPVLGRYLRDVALADFAFSTGLMIEGGHPLEEALEEAARSGTIAPFRKQTAAMLRHIREGGSMSSFAWQPDGFPKKFAAALAAAGSSRKPGRDLVALSDAYLREAKACITALSSAVMPAMLVLTGGLMALQLVAMASIFFALYPYVRGAPW
jgi:general secretion pathway protein F